MDFVAHDPERYRGRAGLDGMEKSIEEQLGIYTWT